MALTHMKWSIEDYHHLIDAGILTDRPVELLNGEIVEMSPEGEPHAHDSTEARDYLIRVLGDRAKIRDGKPITLLGSNSEPEPDLAIVQPLGREYREHHPYPENIFWLIEFSNSSLAKDLEEKPKVYAAANIPEYWVVNLRTMQLIVFRSPIEGTYSSQQTFDQGTIRPLAFPNVALAIDPILGR